ncbi:hypothetical protein [Bradyrhizobium sp. S69]|jgi:hypothetical protein|uniref:hypothetical protein n=1 Tax=Bradyrhizobium sp. S69 TaxID=1641856 RepID=UPI00131C7613|nr:hypothetical protein [Bradyrhizobium sp. S69]
MRVFPQPQSGPFAFARNGITRRKRAAVEPMLPALIRAVAFFSTLPLPFFAALFIN